ncbi:MAG: NUDIX domain-containing protein [Oscillospiraceae bacterium]|nr:NUDIX domain-containing protein [Oscillospiraceae bacterium]MDD7293104.1 NUDIX domain-containing protein [Clostridiaceae bacterium]MDY5992050.1 NUDIX domain-containing protein [Oscillospiraceae bacterium]
MLGKFVRVRVTSPMHSYNKRFGFKYRLNYGIVEGGKTQKNSVISAYIMGINHPVRNFDGRVIAIVRRNGGKGVVLVVAPKSTRFIVNDIRRAIDFAEGRNGYTLECLYESSCGAVVFRNDANEKKFLLIRNKRSAHWGFPKGHIEPGENNEQTAIREVLEETGINIRVLPNFKKCSEYTIQGRIEKSVSIFLAETDDVEYTIQPEEIEECGWFSYYDALKTLNYDNDKRILEQAKQYLLANCTGG